MNKSQLVEVTKEIVEKAIGEKITKKASASIVEGLFEAIKSALVNGEEVTLPEIGKLKVANKAARKGTIKRDGEEIPYDVPAGKRIKLTASKGIKEAING